MIHRLDIQIKNSKLQIKIRSSEHCYMICEKKQCESQEPSCLLAVLANLENILTSDVAPSSETHLVVVFQRREAAWHLERRELLPGGVVVVDVVVVM